MYTYIYKYVNLLSIIGLLLFVSACTDSALTEITYETDSPTLQGSLQSTSSTANAVSINLGLKNPVGINVPFRSHQRTLVESTNFESLDPLTEAIVELGVGFVRVSGIKMARGVPNTNLAFCRQLWEVYGVKTLALPPNDPNDTEILEDFLAAIRDLPEMFVYVEGPNEQENEDALAYMELLTQELVGIVPLAEPSLKQINAYEADLFSGLPLKVANGHLYPNGSYPYNGSNTMLDKHIAQVSESLAPGAPIIVSETGYHDTNTTVDGQPPVAPGEAAKWLPQLVRDMVDRGVALVSIHELQDDVGPETRQWGLLEAEMDEAGKPIRKPVFYAVRGMLAQWEEN